jgi:hypothetical protein
LRWEELKHVSWPGGLEVPILARIALKSLFRQLFTGFVASFYKKNGQEPGRLLAARVPRMKRS